MAIPAVNATYLTSAPVPGGSGILAFGGSSCLEVSYIGTATFVLDGSLTTTVLNFEDGTNALPWTPSAILAARCGGNAVNTVVAWATVANNVAANVNFSAAGTNTNTVQIAFFILK